MLAGWLSHEIESGLGASITLGAMALACFDPITSSCVHSHLLKIDCIPYPHKADCLLEPGQVILNLMNLLSLYTYYLVTCEPASMLGLYVFKTVPKGIVASRSHSHGRQASLCSHNGCQIQVFIMVSILETGRFGHGGLL